MWWGRDRQREIKIYTPMPRVQIKQLSPYYDLKTRNGSRQEDRGLFSVIQAGHG
jgi:hypothetical protein